MGSVVAALGPRRVGSVAVVHGAHLPQGMWDLPGPGIEPGSPALQADSLPSEPLQKVAAAFKLVSIYSKTIRPSAFLE